MAIDAITYSFTWYLKSDCQFLLEGQGNTAAHLFMQISMLSTADIGNVVDNLGLPLGTYQEGAADGEGFKSLTVLIKKPLRYIFVEECGI